MSAAPRLVSALRNGQMLPIENESGDATDATLTSLSALERGKT